MSVPWLDEPVPGPEPVGVGVGVGVEVVGGTVVGAAVGDGVAVGLVDPVGVGDDVGEPVGEPEVVVGDGDADGDDVGLAVGDAVGDEQAVGDAAGDCDRWVGVAVGTGPVACTPGDAVEPAEVTYTGVWVGAALAWSVQRAAAAEPGTPAPRVVTALLTPWVLLTPGTLVPLPAGAPPPCPAGRLGALPPVITVELTWTMACLKGGTASARLAMKATPASTPSDRIQAVPGVRDGVRAVARCRAFCADAGRAQWPRQTKCLAWLRAPTTTLTGQGCGVRPFVRARIRSSPSTRGST